MHKLVSALSSFVLAFLVALPALAFMPNDAELALQLQKNFGALTSWEAEMSFPEYPEVTAHIWYARGKWRQEWKAGDKATALGMNGNVVAKCTAEAFALSPLFVWLPPNPVQTWRAWGMDNATRSYVFCGDSPCLMFGANPGDETASSVQLNNEDMAPLQVRYASDLGLVTVQFSEYKTLGGFRVPENILFSVNDTVLDVRVKWIGVNRADDEMLYVRDALDGTPCAAPPPPFDILRNSFRYPQAK